MKRKHKRYSKPKRPFDKVRIDEETKIKKEFGLKNKKEIWKADSKIKSFREKAKKLIGADEKSQHLLFERLKKIGLNVGSIADVLSLDKRDYLQRRLQTIVAKKRIAPSAKAARQYISHKKILVNGKVVNSPSYIVAVELENKIEKKKLKPKIKKQPVTKDKIAENKPEENTNE